MSSRVVEVGNAEAAAIMEFLDSTIGQKLVSALKSRRPPLGGKNMEEKFASSALAEGWEKCIDEMISIAETRNDPIDLGEAKPINPSLEDDRRDDKKPKNPN